MDRTVNVIENLDGKKTVIIQDIRFRGKMVKLTGSMSFMQVYLSGMRRMEENIFMIL